MKIYISILISIVAILVALALVLVYNSSVDKSPEVYFKKARRNYELGRYDDAINDFNEYLSVSKRAPNDLSMSTNVENAQFMIASSLRRLKKQNLAKNILVNIINDSKYQDNVVNAVMEYADICRIDNVYDDYIFSKLQHYLKYPKDPFIENKINMLYGYQLLFQKRYGDALVGFLRSDGELAILGRARVYFDMGEHDRAYEVYEDFLKYYQSSDYYAEIVRTYKMQVMAEAHRLYIAGNPKSRFYYEKMANLFPNTIEGEDALIRIAHTYRLEKNYSKAIEYYSKVRYNNINTADSEATYFLSVSYFETGKIKDAYLMFDNYINKYSPPAEMLQKARDYMKLIENEAAVANY